ncbi:UDP-GlcNAc:betaGal beta-1,3-N-acetylglucosaminyltransferase-like protein 1 [Bicyclus anynana]|uniref:UDP-GlcNAc:betaGal beta-1,3-N-acetylglucosaminyltransferase-like protein 1 n=1 Tax=Bicyclus anynana TaxID=110368 RepID=A0A6J1NVP4_BICAN|nr:UDP-GlcNAc:betaGal beta-1,3-N-acetylglucosaminyltransferase-like protein 1 [Bicyclus anynana]
MINISVIIPVHNGEKWINNCMKSIANQTIFDTKLEVEIVVYNDGSTDRSKDILDNWIKYFHMRNISLKYTGSEQSKGVGAAKNAAVYASSGQYLCFQDIDDVMHNDRILMQWEVARLYHSCLIGCRISRDPPNSTPRFVRWANNIKQSQMKLQIYLSYGPTILMPTWFCHRSVFDKVGGFDETGFGTPEDLIFFYNHIDAGGDLYRVDNELLIYTYHKDATTFSVMRNNIQKIQLKRLEMCVLPKWEHITVWNAGKAGRRFVRMLNPENIKKVKAFCDIDKKKIGRTIELYCPRKRKVIAKLPVINFINAKPPIVICVKLDLTNGDFENNLKCLNLIEGSDYVIFS